MHSIPRFSFILNLFIGKTLFTKNAFFDRTCVLIHNICGFTVCTVDNSYLPFPSKIFQYPYATSNLHYREIHVEGSQPRCCGARSGGTEVGFKPAARRLLSLCRTPSPPPSLSFPFRRCGFTPRRRAASRQTLQGSFSAVSKPNFASQS